MRTLNPKIHLTDSNFIYTPAAKTDIRDTFRRFSPPKNQDNNKPLVALGRQNSNKPLVEPILNPEGFVLPAEWFQVLD